jgi:hypothetical protein
MLFLNLIGVDDERQSSIIASCFVLDYRDNDPQEGLSKIVSGIQVIQTRVL